MQVWQHVSGKLYMEIGQHGPWKKFVPYGKLDSPILYVDHEFIRFYKPVVLN